jgi:hypothetical protein
MTVRAEAMAFIGVGWALVVGYVHGELLQHETDKGGGGR